MTKNSLPAEEILKHICKHKKSRALGMKAKVQLFQKVERMHKNICLQIAGWVQLAI